MDDLVRGRLRWRCRRGTRELDMLLGDWLERRWPGAAPAEKQAFQWLVEQANSDLTAWLFGGRRPADATRAALVNDIVRRRD